MIVVLVHRFGVHPKLVIMVGDRSLGWRRAGSTEAKLRITGSARRRRIAEQDREWNPAQTRLKPGRLALTIMVVGARVVGACVVGA
jgi:hypothetical protein